MSNKTMSKSNSCKGCLYKDCYCTEEPCSFCSRSTKNYWNNDMYSNELDIETYVDNKTV